MLIPTPTNGDLSLYIHLPFCQKKCDYCHFFVLPNQERFKKMLFESLLLEIDLYQKGLKNKTIISLYFGGGTPALVGPSYLSSLIETFSKYISLASSEITLELNPENQNLDDLKNFKAAGVSRLSIGVQSFDDFLLKKLGREHTSKNAMDAILNANQAGFENLSIDLMYELPNQSLSSWQDTLNQASRLPISHISLYNLSIEPHTAFYKHRKTIRKEMPRPSVALKMYEMAHFILKEKGWQPYEISAFAKNNFYSRHNVGYWLQRNHLGFGPSACSLIDGVRWQNVKNLKSYSEQLRLSKKPIEFTEKLSKEAFLRESLCLQLRLYQGLDIEIFQNRFGVFSPSLQLNIEQLIQQNLLIKDQSRLTLSDQGRLYHDEIASQLVAIELDNI